MFAIYIPIGRRGATAGGQPRETLNVLGEKGREVGAVWRRWRPELLLLDKGVRCFQ